MVSLALAIGCGDGAPEAMTSDAHLSKNENTPNARNLLDQHHCFSEKEITSETLSMDDRAHIYRCLKMADENGMLPNPEYLAMNMLISGGIMPASGRHPLPETVYPSLDMLVKWGKFGGEVVLDLATHLKNDGFVPLFYPFVYVLDHTLGPEQTLTEIEKRWKDNSEYTYLANLKPIFQKLMGIERPVNFDYRSVIFTIEFPAPVVKPAAGSVRTAAQKLWRGNTVTLTPVADIGKPPKRKPAFDSSTALIPKLKPVESTAEKILKKKLYGHISISSDAFPEYTCFSESEEIFEEPEGDRYPQIHRCLLTAEKKGLVPDPWYLVTNLFITGGITIGRTRHPEDEFPTVRLLVKSGSSGGLSMLDLAAIKLNDGFSFTYDFFVYVLYHTLGPEQTLAEIEKRWKDGSDNTYLGILKPIFQKLAGMERPEGFDFRTVYDQVTLPPPVYNWRYFYDIRKAAKKLWSGWTVTLIPVEDIGKTQTHKPTIDSGTASPTTPGHDRSAVEMILKDEMYGLYFGMTVEEAQRVLPEAYVRTMENRNLKGTADPLLSLARAGDQVLMYMHQSEKHIDVQYDLEKYTVEFCYAIFRDNKLGFLWAGGSCYNYGSDMEMCKTTVRIRRAYMDKLAKNGILPDRANFGRATLPGQMPAICTIWDQGDIYVIHNFCPWKFGIFYTSLLMGDDSIMDSYDGIISSFCSLEKEELPDIENARYHIKLFAQSKSYDLVAMLGLKWYQVWWIKYPFWLFVSMIVILIGRKVIKKGG